MTKETHWVVERDPVMLTSVQAAVDYIESELTRCWENQHQCKYISPFGSSALYDPEPYSNEYITIRPYYWGHDDDIARLPNLETEHLRISWYKHSHRGLFVEFAEGFASYDVLAILLAKSIESIRRDFHDGPSY